MNVGHGVSDLIIRIKNASLARRKEVLIPFSNLNKSIVTVLKREGFVEDVREFAEKGRKGIKVGIKYNKRHPSVTDVIVVSKPSLRIYKASKDISAIERRGRHTVILSTSQGIMTGKEAKKKGLGGEILFEIW